MNVAVSSDFLVPVDFAVPEAERHDLPFFIDGKCPGQHDVTGKISDDIIQVNHLVLARPEKRAGTQRVRHRADDKTSVVDVEGFAVDAGRRAAQRLHPIGAGPDEGSYASATF